MTHSKSSLTALLALSLVAASTAISAAGIDHTDKVGCYFSVHSQCYIESEPPCSDDDYQWGLDQCDSSYPAQVARPPVKPLGLKAPTGRVNMVLRAKLKRIAKK